LTSSRLQKLIPSSFAAPMVVRSSAQSACTEANNVRSDSFAMNTSHSAEQDSHITFMASNRRGLSKQSFNRKHAVSLTSYAFRRPSWSSTATTPSSMHSACLPAHFVASNGSFDARESHANVADAVASISSQARSCSLPQATVYLQPSLSWIP
jgi:hypothetical protein